tara:strand:- start:226 stop:930 length:705 start_codon:yes stop_codon:yes gene_type:complete
MKNILQKLIFKLTVIVLCASFIYSNYLYIKMSNKFKLNKIDIIGNNYINNEIILNTIEPHLSDDIRKIKIEKIKQKLIKNNFIDKIKIYKQIPSKITIEIDEKNPIALVNDYKKNYFIDSNKNIIPADLSSINFYINIPIVSADKKINTTKTFNIISSIYKNNYKIYENLNEVIFENKKIKLIFNNLTKVIINDKNFNEELNSFFAFTKQVNMNLESYNYLDFSNKDLAYILEN